MATVPRVEELRAHNMRYRIDFALIVITGNLARYLTIRPIVERDPTVTSRWYPIRTWVADDPLRFLPDSFRVRMRHFLDSWRLYIRPSPDAIVIHAFETYYLYALLQRIFGRKTVIVNNPDAGFPISSRTLQRWLFKSAFSCTTLFIPWSNWAGACIREQYPQLTQDRLVVIHPGVDLTRWPLRPPTPPAERFRILFVGGDLERKGADTLLDAFEQYLADSCELHLATQSGYLSSSMRERIERLQHVVLHLDLNAGSEPLKQLYRESDVFVLPTNQDASSIVAIESMATGVPVIICPQGGIPDIVVDGETGLLIPPKDATALARAVERLRACAELREKIIIQGRAHVEQYFDANKNTQQLLSVVKMLIDKRRNKRK